MDMAKIAIIGFTKINCNTPLLQNRISLNIHNRGNNHKLIPNKLYSIVV